MPRPALVLLLCVACLGRAAASDDDAPQTGAPHVLPGIRVHNPTDWDGPVNVEVPAGHLASPGLIDWSSVQLVAQDGSDVVFASSRGPSALEGHVDGASAESALRTCWCFQ